MFDINPDLVRIAAENRRQELEKLNEKYPELFNPGGPSEEYLIELRQFIFEKPQKIYNETVFKTALQYLTDYYHANPGELVTDFAMLAENWKKGELATAYYSKNIYNTKLDGLEREPQLRG